MTIGGVSVPKQAVELAQKMSAQFSSGEGSDGLLGLAWPDINTVSPQPVKTPVQNMIEQGLIAQPLFTVKLDRGDNAGFYSFGEVRSLCYAAFFALMFIPGQIDETVTSNPITYTPVDKYISNSQLCGAVLTSPRSSQGFWMVPSTSYTLNGKTIARPDNTAILDTGSTSVPPFTHVLC